MLIWTFSTRSYIYGNLYKNRVNISSGSGQSDASITIGQLTMADNGTYECSVSLMADLDGTSKSRVRLLVLGECPRLLPGWQEAGGAGGCQEGHPSGRTKPEPAVPPRGSDAPRRWSCLGLGRAPCVPSGQKATLHSREGQTAPRGRGEARWRGPCGSAWQGQLTLCPGFFLDGRPPLTPDLPRRKGTSSPYCRDAHLPPTLVPGASGDSRSRGSFPVLSSAHGQEPRKPTPPAVDPNGTPPVRLCRLGHAAQGATVRHI